MSKGIILIIDHTTADARFNQQMKELTKRLKARPKNFRSMIAKITDWDGNLLLDDGGRQSAEWLLESYALHPNYITHPVIIVLNSAIKTNEKRTVRQLIIGVTGLKTERKKMSVIRNDTSGCWFSNTLVINGCSLVYEPETKKLANAVEQELDRLERE